jgi:hypothetical protein
MRCQDFSVPGNCTQRQRRDALQGWLQPPQHLWSNAKALLLLFDLASNGNQAPIKETGEVHRPMLVEMLLCSGEQFFKPFKKTKHTKTTAHE